ncbi:hypothetical protein K1719_034637 [Acacia pycnantha]|nr:hypothetical protein K1719_034637 [Acacia pycnantha]
MLLCPLLHFCELMNWPIWWKWRAMALVMAITVSSRMGVCFDNARSLSSLEDAILRLPVNDKNEKDLSYYFVESDFDPDSKPLVLWLNGGPGSSSLGVGAFSENEPFRLNAKVLIENKYSWNKEANMLYLETLVGVGFSYAKGSSSHFTLNDEATVLLECVQVLERRGKRKIRL